MSEEQQTKRNESREDYLEAILRLGSERPVVRSVDIADFLGFSKTSISIAMKKLLEDGYIHRSKEGYITLTDTGLDVAQEIYTRHRFLPNI